MRTLPTGPAELGDDEAGGAHETVELPMLWGAWYVAGWATEFAGVGPFPRTLLGESLVLYRKLDGVLAALQDRCAHRWAPLSYGRVEGDDVRCMYHGLKFAPDGRCVEVPGQDRIAKRLCVRAYPIVEKYRFVWVWMGDPKRADEAVIPDLGMLEQDWRRVYWGSLDYEANYALITDNLLDLSHISYLHERTVGQPVRSKTEERGESKPYIPGGSEAKAIDNGVRVESWVCGPQARSVLVPRNTPDGDLWTRTDFLAPGIFVSDDIMYPVGTAARCNGGPPMNIRSTVLSDVMSIQAVTPLSARRTRYFYSFGPRSADLDAEESDSMWKIVQETFREDLRMIEAIQRTVQDHPGTRMRGIVADRGLVLFRNRIRKLVASEAAGTSLTEAPC